MDWNRILENTTSILLAGGAVVGAFWIAQKFFGLLEYPGMSPREVDNVAREIDSRFKIVTRAKEGNTFRGVYDTGGGTLYYYRYQPGQSYMIYPLLYERYTTEKTIIGNVQMLYPR